MIAVCEKDEVQKRNIIHNSMRRTLYDGPNTCWSVKD